MLHRSCSRRLQDKAPSPPGRTTPPFLRHPFVVVPHPTSLPMDDPATSRGQLRRRSPPPLSPATIRALARGPEPRRKSEAVFIAGTLPCPRSQPSLAPSVPGGGGALTLPRWVPTDPLHPAGQMGLDLGPRSNTDPSRGGRGCWTRRSSQGSLTK